MVVIAFLVFDGLLEVLEPYPEGFTQLGLILVLRFMVSPDLGPLLRGLGREERTMRLEITQQAIDQFDDWLGAASGEIEPVVAVVGNLGIHHPQELGIACTPAVEALLQVAHEEGCPPLGLFLLSAHDLHEVILEDLPLAGAGILEFVEEPMLHAAIQPVIDVKLTLGVQEQGDVVAKGQATPLADLAVVDLVVALQQAMHGLGLRQLLLQRDGVGCPRQHAQRITRGSGQVDGFTFLSRRIGKRKIRPHLAVDDRPEASI